MSVHISVLNDECKEYLLTIGGRNILLGCGFDVTSYSSYDFSSVVKKLNCVLICNHRMDNCGGLPLLLEKYKYKGYVAMTHETKVLAPRLLSEYRSTCIEKRTQTEIYDMKDINISFGKVNGICLNQPIMIDSHLSITAYHSGDVVGGCYFLIECNGASIIYLSGYSLSGSRMVNPAHIPINLKPEVLLTRCDFPVSVSETRTVMEKECLKRIVASLQSGGKVIIPIFSIGFYHDMCSLIFEHWNRINSSVPIYCTDSTLESPGRYSNLLFHAYGDRFHAMWTKDINKTFQTTGSFLNPVICRIEASTLESDNRPMIVFCSPAIVSYGSTLKMLSSCVDNPNNLVILSEYCLPGTPNASLLNGTNRNDLNRLFGVNDILCNIHYFPCGDAVDARSIINLIRQTSPRNFVCNYENKQQFQEISDIVTKELHIPCLEVSSKCSISTSLLTYIPTRISTRLFQRKNGNFEVNCRIDMESTSEDSALMNLFDNCKPLFPVSIDGVVWTHERDSEPQVTDRLSSEQNLQLKPHELMFRKSVKKIQQNRPNKRRKRKSGGLDFLLSDAAASEEEEEETKEAPVKHMLDSLRREIKEWLPDLEVAEEIDSVRVQKVLISFSSNWKLSMQWSFDDEELASRLFSIGSRVLEDEHSRQG